MAPGLLINGDESPVLNGGSSGSEGELNVLCQILTPIGMVGYGFDEVLNRTALQKLIMNKAPTALILDSGSTDSGPDKLALGTMTTPRANYKRDLRKLLALGHEFKVPIIISSAGGSGTDSHVDEFLNIIDEICQEPGNRYSPTWLPEFDFNYTYIFVVDTNSKLWLSIATSPRPKFLGLSVTTRSLAAVSPCLLYPKMTSRKPSRS